MLQSDNLAKVHRFTAFLNKHYASPPWTSKDTVQKKQPSSFSYAEMGSN